MITLEKLLNCNLSGEKLNNFCKIHNPDYKGAYVDPEKNYVMLQKHYKICILNPKYDIEVLDYVRGHFAKHIDVCNVILVSNLKSDAIIKSNHEQLFIAVVMNRVENDNIKREVDHLLDKYHAYLKEK